MSAQQLPRNALAWMIITLFSLVAPHLARIPLWIVAVYLLSALWRVMVYRGSWSFPGLWVKALLTITAFGATYLSYGSLIGLEPTVSLLLTAFALKMIELKRRKDGYVLLFLGYFVCVTEFLFSQDIPIVLYTLLNVILITTGLVALNQPGQHRFNLATIKLPAIMVLQAFPLMLVLFLIFPRIGPLWTVPIKSHTAKTGVSDSMRPGDISNLSQSADVAFRVKFKGDIPPKSELYWRGLVFSELAEGAWTSVSYYKVPAGERTIKTIETSGDSLAYSIIMEPTQQNWLYSLRYAVAERRGILASPDYRIFSPVELEDEFQYEVRSWPDTKLTEPLSSWRREIELALPENSNPRTQQLSRELHSASSTDRDFVETVLAKFNTEPYVYTLRPPTLGEHPMDEFLFQSRRGFCEHYAYAFVVMMRAAGVPARVVAGYQGGEINPVNRTVVVHQFDAHAWAEVWLGEEGWVRVDPTAAVSPDRIEWGLEQAVEAEGSFLSSSLLSPLRYRNIRLLNAIRLRYDALTYQWQVWVIGYEGEKQYDLLRRMFGEISASKFVLVMFVSWIVVLLPVAASLLLKRNVRRLSALDKQFLAFCKKLERSGLVRAVGEAPGTFARRAIAGQPNLAPQIIRIVGLYNKLAYADSGLSETRQVELQGQLTRAVRGLKRPRRSPVAVE